MQNTISNTNLIIEKKTNFSISIIVVLLISIYCLMNVNFWKAWKPDKGTPFVWDVKQYYAYLPATFIHHDLSFKFDNDFWLNETPTGHRIPMATYGMSLMYLPAFLVGYKIAINSKEKIDGYSDGFKDTLQYGTIFYFTCALLILRSLLLRYFKEITVSIGLLTLFFGTNLFYYVIDEGEMTHSYLFFLFCSYLWLTVKWHETPKIKFSILLGLVLGLATLIRPTEASAGLIFVLYGIRNKSDFKTSFTFFKSHWIQLAIIAFCFFLVLLPQMIYWKINADSFWYNSYGNASKFYFENPKFIKVLFGYRKGWLLYTPIMIFAIAGIFLSKKYIPKFNIPIIIYFLINLYLISSWWCWWFGGSFGMRALVQTYAFLVFFLCVFIEKIIDSNIYKPLLDNAVKLTTAAIFIFLINLNLIQAYQAKKGILHYDAMTKKAYWTVFGKFELTGHETGQYWTSLKAPDYDGALKYGTEK